MRLVSATILPESGEVPVPGSGCPGGSEVGIVLGARSLLERSMMRRRAFSCGRPPWRRAGMRPLAPWHGRSATHGSGHLQGEYESGQRRPHRVPTRHLRSPTRPQAGHRAVFVGAGSVGSGLTSGEGFALESLRSNRSVGCCRSSRRAVGRTKAGTPDGHALRRTA